MKKVFAILLAFVMIFSLCSCGEKSQIRKAQDKIVEIGEQFLNYDITADEAKDQLDSIIVPESDGDGLLLEVHKGSLRFLISKSKIGLATFEEIKEQIDEIKNWDYDTSSVVEKSPIQKAQDEIIEIGEQFLDYELTADDAIEKIKSVTVPECEGKPLLEMDSHVLIGMIVNTKTGIVSYDGVKSSLDVIKEYNYDDITANN